jgi:hypothetical protein
MNKLILKAFEDAGIPLEYYENGACSCWFYNSINDPDRHDVTIMVELWMGHNVNLNVPQVFGSCMVNGETYGLSHPEYDWMNQHGDAAELLSQDKAPF